MRYYNPATPVKEVNIPKVSTDYDTDYHMVACPKCAAEPGKMCHNPDGTVLRSGSKPSVRHPDHKNLVGVHMIRAKRFLETAQNRCVRVRLLNTDPEFKLEAGEVLIGYIPMEDPSRVNILRAEKDRYAPVCWQPRKNTKLLNLTKEPVSAASMGRPKTR